jgi:serine/threonine protein phosphatase PrpC
VRHRRAGGISIVVDALEQFGIAYDIHLWLRCISWLGLISGALLLLRVSSGFPPRAWYLLLQAAPQIPHLLVMRGPVIILSLVALVVLSLTWLALWVILLWASVAVVWHWWQNTGRGPIYRAPSTTGWQSSRHLSANRASNRVFRQAEISLDHSEYADTQRTPAPTLVKSKRTSEMYVEHVGIGWDAGIVRRFKPNEDSLVALRSTCTHNGRLLPLDLYVVADGMGGHSHGQEASRLAVQCMMRAVLSKILSSDRPGGEFLIETLVEGVQWANRAVHESSQTNGIEMGTTITSALIFDGTAYIVNVGDSRTYVYRASKGRLSQVTRDHSLVARLVEVGAISREEVYTHPDRNKVYRGLGEKGEVKVDWFTLPVQEGDYLILCSDGLWEMVRDQEIEGIMKKCVGDPARASAALVESALRGGGADNISVIVARVGG